MKLSMLYEDFTLKEAVPLGGRDPLARREDPSIRQPYEFSPERGKMVGKGGEEIGTISKTERDIAEINRYTVNTLDDIFKRKNTISSATYNKFKIFLRRMISGDPSPLDRFVNGYYRSHVGLGNKRIAKVIITRLIRSFINENPETSSELERVPKQARAMRRAKEYIRKGR